MNKKKKKTISIHKSYDDMCENCKIVKGIGCFTITFDKSEGFLFVNGDTNVKVLCKKCLKYITELDAPKVTKIEKEYSI